MLFAVLLLPLLSGIYAHPHSIELRNDKKTSNIWMSGMDLQSRDREGIAEKRQFPARNPYFTPYPPGYNARTCPHADVTLNSFSPGLELAAIIDKRSIEVQTANHTEDTDLPSLLEGRDNFCTVVAYIDEVKFKGPAANTPEVLFRYGHRYAFSFDFNDVVTNVVTWKRVGPDGFTILSTDAINNNHGTLPLLRGMNSFIHYYFEFRTHSNAPPPVRGMVTLYELLG
ncbi:hypothetical protein MMC07_009756 [Pseudocyphellaria aurata]|nr:hypothetical protein [Pseudocyphellaria aurata]